jgi:hypothetical protein
MIARLSKNEITTDKKIHRSQVCLEDLLLNKSSLFPPPPLSFLVSGKKISYHVKERMNRLRNQNVKNQVQTNLP